MLRRGKLIKLANCFIITKSVFLFIGCNNQEIPIGATGLVHKVNTIKINNLKHEIGNQITHVVTISVGTNTKILKSSQKVTSTITGHKEFAGSIRKKSKSIYEKGKDVRFGDVKSSLIIHLPGLKGLDEEYDFSKYGALRASLIRNGRKQAVLISDLKRNTSLNKIGFCLIDYDVRRVR